MFWAGILGKGLVGPFRVPEGVKKTSAKYVEFLTDRHLLADIAALLGHGDHAPTIHYSIHFNHPGLHGTHQRTRLFEIGLHVFLGPLQTFLLVSIV